MKRDSLFDHMKEPISKKNTTTVFSSSSQEVEKLSSDLSLLLSNPNLTKSLSDGSLDLISYSQVVQKELSNLESECIAIYHEKSNEIASLRDEIDGCDGVLTSLQEMLLGFQADLGGLSSDIRMLQDQSHTLEVQLRNRKAAESALRKFLERIVIPPNLADVICHREVDVVFMECVRELNEKYAYVHGNDVADQRSSIEGVGNESEEKLQEQEEEEEDDDDDLISGVSPRDTIAGREMKTHIDKLRLKAVARTREFFLAKIAELRRPKTNVRMIQINSLLKYAPLNEFLAHGAPDVYMEVRDAYVESMSKTLHALFRTYQAQLSRVDSQIATRHDFLIAVEDAALRDVFSTKVNLNKRGDTFFLGERSTVLDLVQNHARPILVHVALARGERYPYEMIFRSVMTHLMDSVTNEHVFTHHFFSAGNKAAAAAADADSNHEKLTLASIRTESFARTLSLVLEQLENYLFNCYDCLALLLMIKITHANRRIMKSRKIFILDDFLSRITMLLWPRLKMVMDAQLRSIRSANAKRLGGVELHAHYISRRYAEFTSSILLILNKGRRKMQPSRHAHHQHSAKKATRSRSSKPSASEDKDHMDQDSTSKQPSVKSTDTSNTAPPSPSNPLSTKKSNSAGDMLMNDLSLILDETVQLLERLADESLKSNKRKIVFLINNLDQIITIFQERRIVGREMNRFVELLMQQRELFVEEELLQNYSKIIAFVQQTESHISRQGPGSAGSHTRMELNEAVVENLVLDFKLTWKKGIEDINRNVLSYFSNFRNGMEILKQSLTQLLLYYTRFQDIIRKTWRSKPPAWCKDLISTTVILGEIKKYALSI